MVYIEKDLYVYKTLAKQMQAISSFPNDGQTFDSRLNMKFAIPRIIFGTPVFFGIAAHLYQSLSKGHNFEAISALYWINFAMMYYSANVMFLMKGNELLKFLKSLSEMRKENLENYEKIVSYTEKLTKILFYSTILATITIFIESYMKDMFCNNGELVDDPQYVCGILIPFWFPFKKKTPAIKPACALYVLAFALTQVPAMVSTTTLYLGSVEFIGLKIRALIRMIKETDGREMQNKKHAQEKLKICIEYYMSISKLVNEMNGSIGFIFAPTQNAYNNVLMGIAGYFVIKMGSIPNGFQLVLWLGVQWVSCYSGQRLENVSLLLKETVYDLPWYNIHPSSRSNFRLFHASVSLTLHMKIQPITKMNMENFAKILKGAYTFLMYLLKM